MVYFQHFYIFFPLFGRILKIIRHFGIFVKKGMEAGHE